MKIGRYLALILVIALLLLPQDLYSAVRTADVWWIPENVSQDGIKIDNIFYFIYYMTLFVFIATQAVLIYFMVKYRKKNGVKAQYIHGNNKLEIIWTAIPLIIFLALAIYSNNFWSQMKRQPMPQGPVVEVDVVAEQFNWHIRYAGPDGKLGSIDPRLMQADNVFATVPEDPAGVDDVKMMGEMVVPEGVPIRLHLRSRDVIHSFYVPEFRFYQDAVPGKMISWNWFHLFKTGDFQIACSQLCGANHYKMFAKLRIVSQEEFQKWVNEKSAEQQAERQPPAQTTVKLNTQTRPSTST